MHSVTRSERQDFAAAKIITVQGCAPGEPLVEEVFKKWVGGERLMCRPLFGTTTECYRWNHAARFWEYNWGFPSIAGSPDDMQKLCAFQRRLRVVKLHASFTSNPKQVDIEKGVFREGTQLTEFLESPHALKAYIDLYLLP